MFRSVSLAEREVRVPTISKSLAARPRTCSTMENALSVSWNRSTTNAKCLVKMSPEDRISAVLSITVLALPIIASTNAPALLFDIPLLFETGGDESFDKVIVVSAPIEVPRERVLARSGMTAQKLDAILARQMPDEEKRKRADFVVDTSGDLSTTEEQVHDILSCLGIRPVR